MTLKALKNTVSYVMFGKNCEIFSSRKASFGGTKEYFLDSGISD
jgi:hypothetical protein